MCFFQKKIKHTLRLLRRNQFLTMCKLEISREDVLFLSRPRRNMPSPEQIQWLLHNSNYYSSF